MREGGRVCGILWYIFHDKRMANPSGNDTDIIFILDMCVCVKRTLVSKITLEEQEYTIRCYKPHTKTKPQIFSFTMKAKAEATLSDN